MARSEAPASAKAAGNSYPLCLPPPRQSSTLLKVQIRPPKGVIGAGMGLGHRCLQAEPGFEQPTRGA